MKESLRIAPEDANALQALYSPNWTYYEDESCRRRLQMLFPYRNGLPQETRFPLILFIPGSAWHTQEMYNDVPQYAKLAQRGFVVAAMQYRESDIAAFPAQVEDVCRALQYLPTIADNFRIDMKHIYLMGNSSGGHIAVMAALLNAHGLCAPLPPLSGVICESGSTDLLLCAKAPLPSWITVRPSAALLGVDKIEGHKDLAEKASCARYVTKDVKIPPVLLLHSEKDPVVTVECSRTLHDQLTSAHQEVRYVELAGCDAHGGAAFYTDQVLDLIDTFCKQHMA